jgi:23S rRNA maturation mini-RNase III
MRGHDANRSQPRGGRLTILASASFLTHAGEEANLLTEFQASLTATDAAWLRRGRNIECKRSRPALSLRLRQDMPL